MHSYLMIRIRAHAGEDDAPMQWAELNNQGETTDELHEGDWPALRNWLNVVPSARYAQFADNVILLLSGTLAMLYQVSLNKGQKKHIGQALPFLLEEHLAADVEAFHFSHRMKSDRQVDVAVMAKELLQQLIDVMAEIKIEPAFVIAENQLFPQDDGHVQLFFEGDYAHICRPYDSVQTLEVSALPLITDDMISAKRPSQESNEEGKVPNTASIESINACYMADNEAHYQSFKTFIQQHFPDIVVKGKVLTSGHAIFLLLAQTFFQVRKKRSLIDFRTGPFSCYRRIKKQWQAWRWVAVAASLWVVLEIILYTSSGFVYQSRAKHFSKASLSAYKQAFPQDRSVVDVRASLERKMRGVKNVGGDDVFLKLLKRLSGVKEYGSKVVPKSLDYNESGHRLAMDVSAVSYEELNRYVEALRKQGLSVNLSGANKEGKQVLAKLVVTQ